MGIGHGVGVARRPPCAPLPAVTDGLFRTIEVRQRPAALSESPSPRSCMLPDQTVGAHVPVGILGTGSYLPSREITNAELATMVPDVDPDWIVRKTLIEARRFAAPDEATSDLAAKAALPALARAGITAADVDYLIVSTSTGDSPQPPTSNRVQDLIGATRAACFDINVVCAGFRLRAGARPQPRRHAPGRQGPGRRGGRLLADPRLQRPANRGAVRRRRRRRRGGAVPGGLRHPRHRAGQPRCRAPADPGRRRRQPAPGLGRDDRQRRPLLQDGRSWRARLRGRVRTAGADRDARAGRACIPSTSTISCRTRPTDVLLDELVTLTQLDGATHPPTLTASAMWEARLCR